MSMHRKNKCRNEPRGLWGAKWFLRNVARQKRRRELALISKRRNRR